MPEASIPQWIVYKAVNSIDGKTYIGKTSRTLDTRMRDHISLAKHDSPLPLHAAMREHGLAAFTFTAIATALGPEVGDVERRLIREHNARHPLGYNLSAGGGGGIHPKGCKRRVRTANRLTHGHARNGGTRTFHIWAHIRLRCNNPKNPAYKDYGGRGITICERWLKFENFLADNGECPSGLTFDRYPNNDGNYEPGNVRWATPKEQANNRRQRIDARLLTFQGETKPAREWSRDPRVIAVGISRNTLTSRLFNHWPTDRILTEPPDKHKYGVMVGGEHKTFSELSVQTGISKIILYGRVRYYGWDVERALTEPYKQRRRWGRKEGNQP
jgi:hypothetical protein